MQVGTPKNLMVTLVKKYYDDLHSARTDVNDGYQHAKFERNS